MPAVRDYLNERKIPQLFVATGAATFSDPEHFHWTIGLQPNYQTEARIFAKHILKTKPDAKIGVLYPERRLRQGLRDRRCTTGSAPIMPGVIIKELSYETSEPTVDSAGRLAAGCGRRRVRDRRDAEIRRAGDPQELRSRLERDVATSPTSRSRSAPS